MDFLAGTLPRTPTRVSGATADCKRRLQITRPPGETQRAEKSCRHNGPCLWPHAYRQQRERITRHTASRRRVNYPDEYAYPQAQHRAAYDRRVFQLQTARDVPLWKAHTAVIAYVPGRETLAKQSSICTPITDALRINRIPSKIASPTNSSAAAGIRHRSADSAGIGGPDAGDRQHGGEHDQYVGVAGEKSASPGRRQLPGNRRISQQRADDFHVGH